MKVKTGLKKTLALLLTVVLLLTTAPLSGFVGLDLSGVANWFSTTAQAATSGKLTYTVKNGKVTITDCYTSISGSLSIPSTLGGYPVTSIGASVFWGCAGLTSITIPDSVTSIGDSAFYDCTGLTSITIPDSVTSIGNSAFEDCTGLTSITIPDSVTSIGASVFWGCAGLTSITIPDSVTYIGRSAFYGTAWYNSQPDGDVYAGKVYYKYKGKMLENTSIEIKAGTKGIAGSAFEDCTGLTSITIPNSVTSIGYSAFWCCTGLTSITIPNSVTSIGWSAFYDCTGLTSITIPDTVTSIGPEAFSYCTGLTSITIGKNVTSIGSLAFDDCTGLTSVTVSPGNKVYHSENNCIISTKRKELVIGCKNSVIPSDGSVTSIGDYAFDDCTGLTSITIPDSVTSIGNHAFSYCTGLTSITIPDGVTSIGDSAFYDCTGLTSITIPDSVTSIGSSAFSGCTGLTSITIPDSVTSIGDYAFSGCSGLKTVYYAGTKEEWENIYIGSDNYPLKNAKIVYNCVSDNSKYMTGDVGITEFFFCVRRKNTSVDGNVMNIKKLTGEVHPVLKNTKALAYPSSATFTVGEKDKIKIPYGDGKEGITFSSDKHNDYIIPKEVAESFIYKVGKKNDYNETIYMTRDKQDGKPYVSSVYAKTAGVKEAYTNLVDSGSAYSVKREVPYDIIVTAGNIKENATYYISQDNYPSHTLSNSTGVFSSASFENFDKNKTIYAWVVAKNGGSEQIALKMKILDLEDNALFKSLKNGKYSFGGEDGIKITFPKDWALIGGTDLDMSAFEVPAQWTYDPEQGTIRAVASVGILDNDKTKKELTKKGDVWNSFKDILSGLSKEAQTWQQGIFDYKVQEKLRSIGISNSTIRDVAKEKKMEVKAKFLLAIEFAYQNGELVAKEGYGVVEVKVKAKMDGQYAAVVYGISGGADGSFGLTASRQVCSNNAPLSWNLKLSLTPNLKVYAGVGIQHVASASAYGLLKLPFNWSFSQKHIDIALSGEVGLEAKVFIFKKNVPLLSGTLGPANFYYGKKKSNAPMRAPMLPSISGGDEKLLTYEPQSRDYAENTSAWLGEAKAPAKAPNRIKAASTTANGVTIKNLQTSVYDNSNAKVITCGDTTIATWVGDDASRDEYNRTRLVYSVYDANNDTWSAPKAVCDDGFMDANPYLATDGTDIYVAWQKLCKTFNAENSLTDSDILSAGEIYLAKYDKAADSFVDSVRLTNDSVYDYNPVVTIKNGRPVVYYCTSDGNSMSEASVNKITKYSNGNAVIINDNLSTVYSIDVCGDELAYAVDTDGDVKTTDDIRTFYGETTFSKFESNAEQSEMNFAFGKLDGKDTLFVSDGSNIYYNGDGELKTVLEENTSITGQINAVNVGDGLSIFWTQENDVGNEIYTCSYANGKWSGATQSTSRNNKFTNISIAAASNGKIIGMCNETMRELDETEGYYVDKASNLVAFTAKDYFDMTLLYAGINESELVPGQTAKIYATVENNGNIKANNFEIVITDGYGTEIVTEVAEPLDAGKKNTYEIDYLVPEKFEGGDINVGVDDEFDVDSSDNVFTFGIDTPNLVISNNTVSNSGSLYTIDAVVNNTNFTTAKDVTFKAYFGSTEGEPFDSISIGDLSREQYKNIQFSFTENDIITDENGSRFVYLIVEDEDGNDSQLVISLNELDTVCGHPVTEERAEIPSTCTEIGCAAGVFCTACETFISGGEEIPAKGHTEEIVPAVPATCTETGLTEGKKCSVCGTITVEQTIIPLLPHTDENNDAICDVCGQSMSDILPGETKTIQITANEITYLKFIPTVSGTYTFQSNSDSDTYGYLFDENKNLITSNDDGDEDSNFKITYELTAGTVYYWGAGYYDAEDSGSFDVSLSKVCPHANTEERAAKAATCTDLGYTAGVICLDCGEWLSGHEVIYACHTDENDDAVCDVCGKVLSSDILPGETKTIQITANEITYLKFVPTVNGTYTFQSSSDSDTYGYLFDENKNLITSNDDGDEDYNFKITYELTAGTVYYWGARYYDAEDSGSFDVSLTLDKTAECVHNYVAVVTEPTCTTDGYTTYTCSICGKSYIDSIIPALGHDLIIDTEAQKPTCTEGGTTEGKHCMRCDYKVEAETIPALNHDIVIDVEAKDPTCTESGTTEGKHCTRCDYKVEAEVIEPLGHTDSNNDGKCDRCGEETGEPVNPPKPDPSANCTCACHKKGIAKFFFKIGLFFQKIFKKNKICKCGVWHY